MSFPYALLHFETQQAKQRLEKVFHAAAGLRSDSLYPPRKQRHSSLQQEGEQVD
jgi:hypothetical protein